MTATFSAQQQAWQALLEQPLAFVEARRLRECWPQTVTNQQHAALQSASRFQSRLLQLLMGHFHLQPLAQLQSPLDQDLPVLLLSPDDFKRLPRLCGAIWHAATLSREIRSDAVNKLRSALGAEVFALALAHRSLAGAADLLRQPDDLLEAIDRDGASCVAAWLQTQPSALQHWLRLRLEMPQSGNTQAGVPHTAMDLEIVRSAAATFDQFAEEVA